MVRISSPADINRLLNRPLVVHEMGWTTDEYGNQVPIEVARYDVRGYIEQREAREIVVDQQTFPADWLCVLPAATSLHAWDRIEVPDIAETGADGIVRTAVFEVVGTPDRPRRATDDTEHHVEANMRRMSA